MRASLAAMGCALFLMIGCQPPAPAQVPTPKKEAAAVALAAAPAEAPDVIAVQLKAERTVVKTNTSAPMMTQVHVDVAALKNAMRPKINLALVVDTSSSMRHAIADARKAAHELLGAMQPGDRLTVVAFGSEPHKLVASTLLTEANMAEIGTKLDAMEARGSTDMTGGLEMALGEVRAHHVTGGINRVVLISDGVPNEVQRLQQLSQQAGQAQISINGLGLGADYDETTLAQLAEKTGGKFHDVREASEFAALMRKEVLRLEQVVASQARLELSPGPGVVLHNAVGRSIQRNGNRLFVNLGDLAENKPLDVIVRLSLPASRNGSIVEVMDAKVVYQDAVAGTGQQQVLGFLEVAASDDAERVKASRDLDLTIESARFEVAEAIMQAVSQARNGHAKAARLRLERAQKIAKAALVERDDSELRKQLARIKELRVELPKMVAARRRMQAPPPPRILRHSGGPRKAPSMAPAPSMPIPVAPSVRDAHSAAARQILGG